MKMTNTIRLLKLNTNLLSMISLIVLLTIIFPTVYSIAMHDCDEAREDLEAAHRTLQKERSDLHIAQFLYSAALLTRNPILIHVARANLDRAEEQFEKAKKDHLLKWLAYFSCIYDDHSDDEGGADAGGCDSGGDTPA